MSDLFAYRILKRTRIRNINNIARRKKGARIKRVTVTYDLKRQGAINNVCTYVTVNSRNWANRTEVHEANRPNRIRFGRAH